MRKSPAPDSTSELERLRRYQRILLSLGRFLTEDHEAQEFLDHAVAEVSDGTDVERVKILIYRPDHGDLLVVAGIGWNEGVIGIATLPIDVASPPGRAVQTGEPTIIEDIAASTEYRLSGLLKEHDIRALLNVPIVLDDRCWGVLEVDSRAPRSFNEDTTEFLQAVAQLIASALRRSERREAAVEARREIAAEADRRRVLLREMQHRVKNNFQLIVGMLLLQQRKSKTPEVQQVLRALADRVMAIALAHDQLAPERGFQAVSLGQYLGALCRTFGAMADGISVATDLDEAELPLDIAISVGLIVNELVTNSMKHAFDGPGNIHVEFRADVGRHNACVTVWDDGKGMPEEKRPGSSGLALVETLVRQLNGSLERDSPGRGTRVRIRFPVRTYMQKSTTHAGDGS